MFGKEAKRIVSSGAWWGKAAVFAIVAGLAIACYEMIATAFSGGGFWEPLNRIDAVFDGNRSPVMGFDMKTSISGLLLHVGVSAIWGLVLAAIIGFLPKLFASPLASTLTGMGFGLFVAFLMKREIGPRLDEVLFTSSEVHFFLMHTAYGLITAWLLYGWGRRRGLFPRTGLSFPKQSWLRPRLFS